MPRRPEWAGPAEIAYRSRIFSRFRGFLTYGCPLEKFAGLWPALVPISREFTFAKDVPWLNIYDPVDPVSGRLLAFRAQPPTCCPVPQNLGYAAGWLLLHAHLKYLKWRRPGDLASLTIKWLLTDSSIVFPGASGWRLANWFGANSPQALVRSWVIAWTTWILAAVLLALLGAIVLPALLDVAADAWEAMVSKIAKVATGGAEMTYWERVFLLVAIAAWVPVVLGCLAWFTFPKNPRGEPGGVQQQPTPGPFGIENDEPKPGDPDFEEFEDDPGKGRQFETQP